MFVFSGLLGGLFAGLGLSVALKLPIAWVVMVVTNYRLLDPRPETRELLKRSAAIAVAGVLAYELPFRLFGGGLLGLLASSRLSAISFRLFCS
ncbi:MAG: hypothetical protein ACYC7E_20580 [Armatimonadota bacterium]